MFITLNAETVYLSAPVLSRITKFLLFGVYGFKKWFNVYGTIVIFLFCYAVTVRDTVAEGTLSAKSLKLK